jgi:CDP-glucose 4,6-dehydratase
MYQKTYDLPLSIVRCANIFGGGDLNFSRTIPGAIKATLEGERFVIRSDGQFVRDFLHVSDAAAAYLHLAEATASGAPQGAYNFSLEVKLTVLDCAKKVLELLGRTDLEPVILNQASAEIREQYLSCQKAKDLLHWAPEFDFDAGVREAIGWYRGYLNIPAGAASAVQNA